MATLELKLDRTTFLSAVYKAQGVVDRKSTSNILSHLLLETTAEGRVRVIGTDYDVTIEAEVPAEIIVEGRACINGKSLFDVVKNVDDDTVHLRALDNDWVELTAGRSRFKLAGITPADFPEIVIPDDAVWFGLPRATFKDLIDKTAFSVSDDETRMNLNGVNFTMAPGDEGTSKLGMVSTDGHRLSKVNVSAEVEGYEGQALSAIIHKKGVQEIRRLLDTQSEILRVGFSKKVILFRAGGTTFTVRQIEDSYPDIARVIPSSSPIQIAVPREPLIRAIRRNALLTSTKTYIIKLEVQPGSIAVTASNPDYGEGRDEVDVEYEGDGMVIGFNYNYLLDVLNVIRGDTATLELTDEFSPTVVTSPSEPGAIFVVMPMRV